MASGLAWPGLAWPGRRKRGNLMRSIAYTPRSSVTCIELLLCYCCCGCSAFALLLIRFSLLLLLPSIDRFDFDFHLARNFAWPNLIYTRCGSISAVSLCAASAFNFWRHSLQNRCPASAGSCCCCCCCCYLSLFSHAKTKKG